MKQTVFFLIAFLAAVLTGAAQSSHQVCSCPDGKKAVTFVIGHQITLAVCGSEDTAFIKNQTLFFEFTLSACGTGKLISRWGADQRCLIQKKAIL